MTILPWKKVHPPDSLSVWIRISLGFVIGLAFMLVTVQVFVVNEFDYNIIRSGVVSVFRGENPWISDTSFYNPPFSVVLLWPMLFLSAKGIIVVGGALLIALIFAMEAWVALAWFGTNTFLWMVAAGNVDMFVVGAGLVLLLLSEGLETRHWLALVVRVVAYGFLLVKPQGGIFIVIFFILLKRDWKGVLLGLVLYGLPFWNLYLDWAKVILLHPPAPQMVASQSLYGKYGIWIALPIAVWVALARRWKFWQLGAALAQILSPYGMPGVPILLVLTAVKRLSAIPIVLVFSACLAFLTWRTDIPGGPDYYTHLGKFMTIYHLGMFALALILACYQTANETQDKYTLGIKDWILSRLKK